jgi:hypothetical protein
MPLNSKQKAGRADYPAAASVMVQRHAGVGPEIAAKSVT